MKRLILVAVYCYKLLMIVKLHFWICELISVWRVKHKQEVFAFPQVNFDRAIVTDDGEDSTKTVKRTLFSRMNPYPQKKVMTFNKHTSDFNFNVNYGDLSFLSSLEHE